MWLGLGLSMTVAFLVVATLVLFADVCYLHPREVRRIESISKKLEATLLF